MKKARVLMTALLVAAALGAAAVPVSAKMLKTRQAPLAGGAARLPLVIGSGFEFETDNEQTQYDYPFLVEYSFTERYKLTVEPNYVRIKSKKAGLPSAAGFGDLETSLEAEFLSERRYRPALTALGVVKWPTAAKAALGTRGRDYTLGLIASKELPFADFDSEVSYTASGDSREPDTIEISLAGAKRLTRRLDLEVEALTTLGGGHLRGKPGSISGLGSQNGGAGESEFTLGLAQHLSPFLKLEEGYILKNDMSWQLAFAWEWSFSGED